MAEHTNCRWMQLRRLYYSNSAGRVRTVRIVPKSTQVNNGVAFEGPVCLFTQAEIAVCVASCATDDSVDPLIQEYEAILRKEDQNITFTDEEKALYKTMKKDSKAVWEALRCYVGFVPVYTPRNKILLRGLVCYAFYHPDFLSGNISNMTTAKGNTGSAATPKKKKKKSRESDEDDADYEESSISESTPTIVPPSKEEAWKRRLMVLWQLQSVPDTDIMMQTLFKGHFDEITASRFYLDVLDHNRIQFNGANKQYRFLFRLSRTTPMRFVIEYCPYNHSEYQRVAVDISISDDGELYARTESQWKPLVALAADLVGGNAISASVARYRDSDNDGVAGSFGALGLEEPSAGSDTTSPSDEAATPQLDQSDFSFYQLLHHDNQLLQSEDFSLYGSFSTASPSEIGLPDR